MAKAKEPKVADEAVEPAASREDLALAQRAVMDITGVGEPAARDRVGKMKPSLVAEIATLEKAKNRAEIVALLY
jgi:hypothetical protein